MSNETICVWFQRLVAPVALALVSAGCTSADHGDEHTAVETGALVDGGVATVASTPDLAAVGQVKNTAFGACSGTLIAPRTVLTAAHCFFPVAHGCAANIGFPTFVISDSAGNPTGADAQVINVVGVATHPDAYGFDPSSGNPGRVASCPNPVPAPVACPNPITTPNAFLQPSCALVNACYPSSKQTFPPCAKEPCPATAVLNTIGGAWGLKSDHDLALVYLESDPVGVTPLPILTRGWSAPSRGVFEATNAAFDPWVAGNPIVTIAGYGQGSKPSVTRDVGTSTLIGSTLSLAPPPDCAGAVGPSTSREIWSLGPTPTQAFSVPGDSGGPLLFGRLPVPVGPTPNTLPPAAALVEQRYVVGVFSGSRNLPSLLQADNAAWLKARLKDFDGDGIPNTSDNCVAIPNRDQANCNLDAEKDRQATILGDACDPVPCPAGDAATSQTFNSGGAFLGVTRSINNVIQLNTVGSHNFFNGVLVSDPNIQTYFRFCTPNAARGVTCRTEDGQRTHPQFHELATGTPTNPWLPVTLVGSVSGVNPKVDYPSSPPPFVWDYQATYTSWRSSNLIDAVSTSNAFTALVGGPPYLGLDGIFGLRAGDASEVLGTGYRPDNGIHPSPVIDIYQPGAAMARHYFPVTVDDVDIKLRPPEAICPTCLLGCPACGLTLPVPDCPVCGPRLARPIGGDDPFVLVPGLGGRWQLLNPRLPASDAAWRLSPAVRGRLQDSTIRFVPRVEAGTQIADLSNLNLRQGVFVSTTAVSVDSFLVSNTRGLSLEQELAPPALPSASTLFEIALPASATLANSALGTLGGSLMIDDRVKVLGVNGGFATVTGVAGVVNVGADAKVGSVFGDSNVVLRSRATLSGSLWAAGGLQADQTAQVSGTRTVGQPIANGQQESFQLFFPNTNQGARSLEPNQTLALAPGAFSDVSIKSNAKLSLTAGTYFFDSLTLEPSSTLDLDNRAGALFIYVRKRLIYRGTTVERDATKPNILFGVLGTDEVTIEAPFRGTVIAPNAPIALATVTGPGHVGAFYGQSMIVHQDNTVQHRPFSRADCPSTFGCLGGWESTGAVPNASHALGVSPRVDFVPIFSNREAQVYFVGGRLAGTNTLTKEIFTYDIAAGTTRQLHFGSYAPEKVLAATVSLSDDFLWVLDELASGGTTRLTHLDPVSGRAQIVWQGTRTGGYDRYFMAPDLDGSLLLFASSLTNQKFVTTRARWLPFAFGTEQLFKVQTGTGGLVGAGVPSSQGITYVVSGAGGIMSAIRPARGTETALQNLGAWL